ncbi:MAG TPA: guanylate kinase [Candidatus Atribacteria bacterium]|nr:guanylate kinase [Candidatus Atribacteria bacterium]
MIDNSKRLSSFISEENTPSRKGLLFVISGPSGVGKGTLREKVFNIFPDLKYSVSVNTRPPRKEEIEGKDYYFVTVDEFKKRIEENIFVEWAIVHGDFKGTPIKFLIEELHKGRDVLLELDVQGAMQVKEKFPDGIFIFIAPPTWKDLEDRLRKRNTEGEKALEKRLKDARIEIEYEKYYNYLVVNDNIKSALKKLESIVIAERCKIVNYKK